MPSKMSVVLLNGLGASLEYGHSDKIGHLQTSDEVVSDLSKLLEAEKLPRP
jgi:hypothetical protein